jgi:hypothetical protein
LGFLAGDSLKGRFPGTPEDSVLTEYITQQLYKSGMVLMGESGIREVAVDYGFVITENNSLKIGDGTHLPYLMVRICGFLVSAQQIRLQAKSCLLRNCLGKIRAVC